MVCDCGNFSSNVCVFNVFVFIFTQRTNDIYSNQNGLETILIQYGAYVTRIVELPEPINSDSNIIKQNRPEKKELKKSDKGRFAWCHH